jgi:CHAT domain-containing protein
MSRWRVEAQSNATWMAAFYNRLAAGHASPALSAATAMRTLIAGGAGHPYVWAGPQTFGR